jgi:hypothetical protein
VMGVDQELSFCIWTTVLLLPYFFPLRKC